MKRILGLVASILLGAGASGCSFSRMAVDRIGDGLADGGSVFASDDDPELVGAALPFSLKMVESLLATSPDHEGLLLVAASGFTQYAYAFVLQEAERMEELDLKRSRELRARAGKLFLRGRDYALRGLDRRRPGISARLLEGDASGLERLDAESVRFLYWGGVSWAGALTADKGDPSLLADLPTAVAMVRMSVELDGTFGDGAGHEFFISYEGAMPESAGGSKLRARAHYEAALRLSGGRRASVHLALAESVAQPEQDRAAFEGLLARALAVDPDADPGQRLANRIAHRRARWLESKIPELFLDAESEAER